LKRLIKDCRRSYSSVLISRQHRANVGFGDGGTVHDGVAVKPPHGLAPADAAHVYSMVSPGITGLELALVDGEKINRARLLVPSTI